MFDVFIFVATSGACGRDDWIVSVHEAAQVSVVSCAQASKLNLVPPSSDHLLLLLAVACIDILNVRFLGAVSEIIRDTHHTHTGHTDNTDFIGSSRFSTGNQKWYKEVEKIETFYNPPTPNTLWLCGPLQIYLFVLFLHLLTILAK